MSGPQFAEDPAERVVETVGDSLFERDDRVVRYVNIFWTYFRAALRYVAHADPGGLSYKLRAVFRIKRMHLELGKSNEETRSVEARLVIRVIADDVADVLAKEAFDALPKLLAALYVFLHHSIPAISIRRPGPESGNLFRHAVVE